MRAVNVVLHPFLFAGITVPEFLHWYFFERPSRIVRSYLAYLRALSDIFAFAFLIRTLLSPWKQITAVYPVKGMNLTAIGESLTLNCLSRTIGMLFRLSAICMGMAVIAILTVFYGAYTLAWLVFPLFFWVALAHISSALF
ncbi:hypothetical protein FJZ28_01620 [Candidatus Peregrinibacteria bacterium]|nr:hypothetical protein [Candidatus Peregrinibacteria bacterium]